MSKNSSPQSSSLCSHFESNKRSKEYVSHQSKVSATVIVLKYTIAMLGDSVKVRYVPLIIIFHCISYHYVYVILCIIVMYRFILWHGAVTEVVWRVDPLIKLLQFGT